jgi:hypothetical protein
MEISLVHEFEQPSEVVTLTSSLVVPDALAVKVIDWRSLGEVISPLVIDQAYAAPDVAVEAALPVDPAQIESGADMVQSGWVLTTTVPVQFSEQPLLVALRLTE